AAEHESAQANREELQIRQGKLQREVETHKTKRDVLKLRLELKTEETRQLADADAMVAAAKARLQQALVAWKTANVRLDRMTITAPKAGRVLALVAKPGTRLMGQSAVGHQE